jgi:thioredoxin 2
VVRTVAEKLAGEVAVAQINTEINPLLATRFGVRGIPVIMLLHHGRVVGELAGVQSITAILSWYRNKIR